MSDKRVILSRLAALDVDNLISFYLTEAGDDTALRFIEAFEDAKRHISSYPDSGSLRYIHETGIHNLRVWQLARFPQMIFYVDQGKDIHVWRVLHGGRDIAQIPQEDMD